MGGGRRAGRWFDFRISHRCRPELRSAELPLEALCVGLQVFYRRTCFHVHGMRRL